MFKLTGLLAVAVIATGCASKQSTAGWFVTDLRISGRMLDVRRCAMDLDYENLLGAQIAICLMSAGYLCPGGSSQTWTISTRDCVQQLSGIGGAP